MMYKYIFGFIGLVAALIVLYQPAEADKRLYVVTTTAQIADIVRNVSGEDVRVEHLMGTGVDPHLYRPTRSDVSKLKKADIVFYNGLHLEGQMIRLFDKLKEEKTVIGIAERVPPDLLIMDEESQHDPHIWMNVQAWMKGVEIIRDTLAGIDEPRGPHYHRRAELYNRKLALLDTHIRNVIKTIPEHARVLVTAHDAFGYFGDAYGIEVVGIQGLSTESEAGLKHMEELVDLLVERKLPAIFSETSVSDRNIRALMEGSKVRGHDVQPGGQLFSDAMGPEGTYEGTYIGMMEHNVRTLTKALGGTPDPFVYEDTFAGTPTD